MMQNKIKEFIEKQKKRKKLALISDAIFIVLLILMIIPGTRYWFKEQVTKVTMVAPKAEKNYQPLTEEEKNMTFRDESDALVRLSDLSGEVIFLNFWATWCPPCRAEMPAIQSLYDAYRDKVTFIFATNESMDVVQSYFQTNGYNLPVYHPASQPVGKLASQSIPATYIITRDGRLALEKKGAAKWDSDKTKAFLDELIAAGE